MSAVMAKQRSEPEAHTPASASLSPRQGLSSPPLRTLLTALISSSTQPTTSNRQNQNRQNFPPSHRLWQSALSTRGVTEGGRERSSGGCPPKRTAELGHGKAAEAGGEPRRRGHRDRWGGRHLCQQSRAPAGRALGPREPWDPSLPTEPPSLDSRCALTITRPSQIHRAGKYSYQMTVGSFTAVMTKDKNRNRVNTGHCCSLGEVNTYEHTNKHAHTLAHTYSHPPTCTHTHTHSHTYMGDCTHSQAFTCIPTYSRTHTLTCTPIQHHTLACMHTHTHLCAHILAHTHMHAHTLTCVSTHSNTCTHTNIHGHTTHTHMHAHTHLYAHILLHTRMRAHFMPAHTVTTHFQNAVTSVDHMRPHTFLLCGNTSMMNWGLFKSIRYLK